MNTDSPFYGNFEWRDVPTWALSQVTAAADTSIVKFNTGQFSDAHIQATLAYVAAESGKTVAELESKIAYDLSKLLAGAHKKAPLLFGTLMESFIEDEVFDLFITTRLGLVEPAAKFTPSMFSQLRRQVKMEHSPGLFPLKNKLDRLPLANEEYVLLPSVRPEDAKFKSISTAAATEKGTFIFNTHYLQKIMEYAHVKGVLPKGKKYKNNGGRFPPEWCYVEFLLIHEWMHYRQADWHYKKLFKESRDVANWVGDFRSNYELVKSGHPPVPGLLYNRHINYATQSSMREMYDVVRAELDKLLPEEKENAEEHMNKNSDEHPTADNQQHPGGGNSEPGDQSAPPEEQQDLGEGSQKDAGPSTKDPEGEGGDAGAGKGLGRNGSTPSEADMEEDSIKIRKALTDNLEKSEFDIADPVALSDAQRVAAEEAERRRRATQNIKHSTVDYSKERPTYNWEQLLKQFTKDALGSTDESYAKLNRRHLPQMVDQLDRDGSARVKPAEVDIDGSVKLAVAVDTSGSMCQVLGKVYINLLSLLSKSRTPAVADKFNVLRFSDHYELFSGSIKTGTASELDTEKLTPLLGKPNVTMPWLFSTAESGGTELSLGVVGTVERLIRAKHSVLIITDSDCLQGENFDNLSHLIKQNMNKVYVMLSCREEYEQARKLLKIKPNNLSYFA